MTKRLRQLRSLFTTEPLGRSLGAKLIGLKRGWAVVSAVAKDDLLVSVGMVQGGVIAAVADYAGVYAAMSVIPAGHTPAAQLNINFLRPISAGEDIVAVARVVDETRTTVAVAFEVTGAASRRKALGTILFFKPRHP